MVVCISHEDGEPGFMPGSARAPRRRRRRRSASASSACSGSRELGVGVEDRPRPHAGALEQRGVLGQPREAERLQARLAGAEHLALAAQLEVDLGELEAVVVRGRAPAGAPTPSGRRAGTASRARRGRCARAAGAAARCRSARRPRRASPTRSGRRCRPRSPSWRRARRRRPRRTPPSPPASRAGASGRAGARPRKSAQLGPREALVLGGGGARLQRLGLLDQRADDERLAAGPQLLADALVGARALALGRGHVGVDRPAARRAARAGR